jgi:hypothetical protein
MILPRLFKVLCRLLGLNKLFRVKVRLKVSQTSLIKQLRIILIRVKEQLIKI